MNVLIFILSMMGKVSEVEYTAPNGKTYKGTQTNEAAAKYLIEKLHNSENPENLGKIIAITSYEAKKSGKGQFIKGIGEFCKANNFVLPEIVLLPNYIKDGEIPETETITDYYDCKETPESEDGETPKLKDIPGEVVLESVLNEITPNDRVYLDVTGGRRTDVNMMLLLMKLVKYRGKKEESPETFYSNLTKLDDKFVGDISGYNDFYRHLDILDGVNQFVTTGNARQLKNCFSPLEENSPINKLLKAMIDFSDSVNLCSLAGIEKTLRDINSSIRDIEDGKDSKGVKSNMDMFLFREIIPLIKEKFFGNSGTLDYCHVILWCLENGLVQQAVTLYVEKIPKHFVDKGILLYNEELREQIFQEQKKKENTKPGELNLERDRFFKDLMSCDEFTDTEKAEQKLIDELKSSLKNTGFQIENKAVKDAINVINIFCNESRKIDNYTNAAEKILDINKKKVQDKRLVSLASFFKKKNITGQYNHEKVINVITNDKVVLKKLLSLDTEPKEPGEQTILSKMNTIDNALTMDIPEWIRVYVSREMLQQIMADYLYARQIRNRINHAVDSGNESEKLAEKLKAFFEKHDIEYSFSMDNIESQLGECVNRILGLKPRFGGAVMLINLSNHPHEKWSKEQFDAAVKEYSGVVDMSFPNVPAKADEAWIAEKTDEVCREIMSSNPRAVLVQGEMSLTYSIVKKLRENNVKVICACSEYCVETSIAEDGSTIRNSVFRFARYRDYV